MTSKRKTIILASCLTVLFLVFGLIWFINRPQGVSGGKTVMVEELHGDESKKSFTLRTGAETLRQACEEQGLLSGRESEYGLYVLTVDGETADENLQQWWCITKNGAEHFYGVDETMIKDGEQYEFTLKTGW